MKFYSVIAVTLLLLEATLVLGSSCTNGLYEVEVTRWLEGPLSAWHDDAPSVVECPAGMYAAECFCTNQKGCDGAAFDPENPRRCTAFKSGAYGPNVKAVVKCKSTTGIDTTVVSERVNSTSEPIGCPFGYRLASCALNDKWSIESNRFPYVDRSVNSTGHFTCQWVYTSGSNKAYLSAMCIKQEDSCSPCNSPQTTSN